MDGTAQKLNFEIDLCSYWGKLQQCMKLYRTQLYIYRRFDKGYRLNYKIRQ